MQRESFVYVPGKIGPEKKPVADGAKDGGMIEIKVITIRRYCCRLHA